MRWVLQDAATAAGLAAVLIWLVQPDWLGGTLIVVVCAWAGGAALARRERVPRTLPRGGRRGLGPMTSWDYAMVVLIVFAVGYPALHSIEKRLQDHKRRLDEQAQRLREIEERTR